MNDDHGTTTYLERVGFSLQRREEFDGDLIEALIGAVDIGGPSPFPELVPALEHWMLSDRQQMGFRVSTNITRVHAGAAGVGGDMVVALFGAAATVTLQQLWDFLRERLGEPRVVDPGHWLSTLREAEPAQVTEDLARTLAATLDRRRDELMLVESATTEEVTGAVFDVPGIGQYEIIVASKACRIRRRRTQDDPE